MREPAAHALIADCDFGPVARAPYSLSDLAGLRKALLLSEEDVEWLRRSRPILEDQTDAILDVWYRFLASTPELGHHFGPPPTGEPQGPQLAAARRRFARWILGTAEARHDQAWLDRQYAIGLRHRRRQHNPDAAGASAVPFRYLPALTVPMTTMLRPFLARKGAPAADVERMQAAWVKAVLLQTILWSHPYVNDGEF